MNNMEMMMRAVNPAKLPRRKEQTMRDPNTTISDGWRHIENIGNQSASLDVGGAAIYMQMSERATATANGRVLTICEGDWES